LIEAIRGSSAAYEALCKPTEASTAIATKALRSPSHFDADDGKKRA
jgi:hypothetical protein